MTFIVPRASSLAAMLADIHHAAADKAGDRPKRVAAAIQGHLHNGDLLSSDVCRSCSSSYSRHLLHADPAGSYAVVALVWCPGQMSPVHAHRTWCALGVWRGILCEAFYDPPQENAPPMQTRAAIRVAGDTSHGPADLAAIHRIANLSTAEAVSIHVYGASFDRFGQDVNHVF